MKTLLLALLLLALPGCAGSGHSADGGIQHVVVIWLKEPGDAAARAKLIKASLGLREIPGVMALQVGEPLASEREVVDDSFDVALVLTFADEQALASYEEHPKHRRAVEETLAPLAERFLVYDVVLAEEE